MAARLCLRSLQAGSSLVSRHFSAPFQCASTQWLAVARMVPGVASASASVVPAQQCRGIVKTKSSVKKRFRVSGSGSILRQKSGKRHLNIHKSSARISRLGGKTTIKAVGIRKKYGKILNLSPLAGR